MIEDVKRFDPKQQRGGLAKRKLLTERHVEILGPGSVNKTPGTVAGSSQRLQAKQRSIEVTPAVAWIVVYFERSRRVLRLINA
jgi:hypothetical protein